MSIVVWTKWSFLLMYISYDVDWDRLGTSVRAPRTRETLLDFRESCRVTRHSRVFHRLTGSQRTLGFWGVTTDTDYESLMQELTHGQGVWQSQLSTGDFTTFQMHSLTPVAKVWYNFFCVKIKPPLHLSTITKDKTILLYAMTKGFQFDIRSVIERGLIELTQGRCTKALIPPSLITQLCRLAEVSMLDSEEQVQQSLPIPLSKAKFWSPGDSDDETDDDAAATTPSVGDHEVPLSST